RHTRSKRDWSSDVCSSDLSFVILTISLQFHQIPMFAYVLRRHQPEPHTLGCCVPPCSTGAGPATPVAKSSSAWKVPMQHATPKSPTNSCLKPCNGWASTGMRVSRSADHMNPTGSPSAGKSTKTSSNGSKQADSFTRPTPPQQKLKHATLKPDGTRN